MRSQEYETYMHSPEWRAKAEERIRIDGGKCQMCGCTRTRLNPLHAHHLRYSTLMHEDVDKDLVTLCSICHKGVHRMMNRVTDSQTGRRGWTDTLQDKQTVGVIQLNEDEVLYY